MYWNASILHSFYDILCFSNKNTVFSAWNYHIGGDFPPRFSNWQYAPPNGGKTGVDETMSTFCSSCGAPLTPGKKFCVGCGSAVEAAIPEPQPAVSQPQQPQLILHQTPPTVPVQPAPVLSHETQETPQIQYKSAPQQPAPEVPATKPTGMFRYLLYLIATTIPILGLVISILWVINGNPSDRRNLSKAMIVMNAIWIILLIVGLIFGNQYISLP